MPVEEHKELRDLVSQTLQAKGVLQKVQAEIRASVFLALEEQDIFKDKNPFINQPLKDYVSITEGRIAISLVREFLEFFNLEFAAIVFDPETHAGIDYSYEGRTKLARDLKLHSTDAKIPLLGALIRSLCSSLKKSPDKNIDLNITKQSSSLKVSEEVKDSEGRLREEGNSNGLLPSGGSPEEPPPRITSEWRLETEKQDTRLSVKKDNITSLSSLGNLPPLTKSSLSHNPKPGNIKKSNFNDLKALLDLNTGSDLQEDLVSSESDKEKTGGDGSPRSDLEDDGEEVSEIGSGITDENTADISISRESGNADYLEDLH